MAALSRVEPSLSGEVVGHPRNDFEPGLDLIEGQDQAAFGRLVSPSKNTGVGPVEARVKHVDARALQ